MKQIEKLDLLLKGLYEEGKDDYFSLGIINNKLKIQIETIEELRRLAKRLENDGLIGNTFFTRNDISARLTSYGIDYCESDSYSYSGSAIINNTYNINVENSSDTTIVSQSENIEIHISKNEIESELNKIIKSILSETNILHNIQQNLVNQINSLINKL